VRLLTVPRATTRRAQLRDYFAKTLEVISD
jgi:hypothetical protein